MGVLKPGLGRRYGYFDHYALGLSVCVLFNINVNISSTPYCICIVGDLSLACFHVLMSDLSSHSCRHSTGLRPRIFCRTWETFARCC